MQLRAGKRIVEAVQAPDCQHIQDRFLLKLDMGGLLLEPERVDASAAASFRGANAHFENAEPVTAPSGSIRVDYITCLKCPN
jgi:hypothetical protein